MEREAAAPAQPLPPPPPSPLPPPLPSSPATTSSLARAAATLAAYDLEPAAHTEGSLDKDALGGADVLVISGSRPLTDAEADAVTAFVDAGGGLVVLGEQGRATPDALAQCFGITMTGESISGPSHEDSSTVLAELQPGPREEADLLARVSAVSFRRAGVLDADAHARVLARAPATSSSPGAALIAVAHHGAGRVVAVAGADLFTDDRVDDADHRELWLNLVTWAAGARVSQPLDEGASPIREHPQWRELKAATDALRLLQRTDGSLGPMASPVTANDYVDRMIAAIGVLRRHIPHQKAYLTAVREDLATWRDRGYGIPDFTASLECFRPAGCRFDGIEHIVLFAMFKPGWSRAKHLDALIVRVPWPDWLADVEAAHKGGTTFIPATLLDATPGYHGECTTLSPQTVSVRGKTPNHFDAVFSDREAARFRDRAGDAARAMNVNLPPDAGALLDDAGLSQDAFTLLNLLRARARTDGDLPFDPVMSRRCAPYWMYALEELRCDLSAFTDALALEREGLGFARHVQTAILVDRLLRLPVCARRVWDYEGLSGQLLFGFLERTGRLRWTEEELTIDWAALATGVQELQEQVVELHRTGDDRVKLGHWATAYDFVISCVPPDADSPWADPDREFPEDPDLQSCVDAVFEDEFPLSDFYVALQRRLSAQGDRPRAATVAV